MPLKSLNEEWDIEDPNVEIPHGGDRRVDEEHELGSELQKGSQSEAVHVEDSSKT